MTRTILLTILLLAGCGEICQDEMVSGLCLNKNGYSIGNGAVTQTINIVQEELNVWYPNLDLPHILETHGMTAKYVPQRKLEGKVIGEYTPKEFAIRVAGLHTPSKLDFIDTTCFRHYSVLSHELLHFISIEYIGESIDRNGDHTVFAFNGDVSGSGDSVENLADIRIINMCRTPK